jgi:hypothetical protein
LNGLLDRIEEGGVMGLRHGEAAHLSLKRGKDNAKTRAPTKGRLEPLTDAFEDGLALTLVAKGADPDAQVGKIVARLLDPDH